MNNYRFFYGIALLFLASVIFFIGSNFTKGFFHHHRNHNAQTLSDDLLSIKGVRSLSTSCNCDIKIIPSDEDKIIFNYNKDYYKNKTEINGDEVSVDFESEKSGFLNWNRYSENIEVEVYSKSLNSITQEGVGSIECDSEYNCDNLKLVNDGVGSMNFNLHVNKLEVQNSGVGSVSLKGIAGNSSIENSGTGSVKSKELINRSAIVENSGVGSVTVNATDSLDLINSGVGGITYSGTAKVYNNNSSGVGSISKQ